VSRSPSLMTRRLLGALRNVRQHRQTTQVVSTALFSRRGPISGARVDENRCRCLHGDNSCFRDTHVSGVGRQMSLHRTDRRRTSCLPLGALHVALCAVVTCYVTCCCCGERTPAACGLHNRAMLVLSTFTIRCIGGPSVRQARAALSYLSDDFTRPGTRVKNSSRMPAVEGPATIGCSCHGEVPGKRAVVNDVIHYFITI
jgi:hypothetical protein